MLQTFKAELIEKYNLSADVLHLKFKSLTVFTEPAKSGQYMMLLVPQKEDYPARRQFSIASDCADVNTFELVAKIIPGGLASEVFRHIQIGEQTEFQGPAGIFTIHDNDRPKVFLATGTGIAPMKSMIGELLHKYSSELPIYLYWGLQKHHDVYFFDQFRKFKLHHSNFQFTICLSREDSLDMISQQDKPFYHLGRITTGYDMFAQKGQFNINEPDYYLCGNRDVVESLKQYLLDKGIAKERIIFEKF